jgi:hypothetical protein
MIVGNKFKTFLKKNPRVANPKLEHFKPLFQRQFKKINWYDAFMDFAQHGNISILGRVKKMGGIIFHLLKWTFSILTINIATLQNLKNIEQMQCEIKIHMYNFVVCYYGFRKRF